LDPASLALDKNNAEQELADFLETKAVLERLGVAEWGGQLYTDMIGLAQKADSFFMKKDFASAADIYAQAVVMAKELSARTGDIFNHLLEEGQMALAQGNGILAQRKFATALMIDSLHPVAQRGLQRSQTIEAVMQLVTSAKQHEKNNNLAVALTDYREALRIDPYFEDARQASMRVEGLIAMQQFKQLMSEGLAAFHRNDLQNARAKLQKAKSIKPDSREVLEALALVDQALRLSRIEILQQDAQAAEQNEDWETALRAYLAVLELDPNLQFAARGKERTLAQIRLVKRVEFFLKKPQELQSDTQLNNAILLLNAAGETDSKGPRLAAQLKELEVLVRQAQLPVKMTIESDNLTEIIIYRVGKLGRLTSHELNLRPGTYTVVGTRDGYHDIRQEVVLKPGQESVRITVTCRVKI
jgi:tetratricopeptide (TPR) repeat protein